MTDTTSGTTGAAATPWPTQDQPPAAGCHPVDAGRPGPRRGAAGCRVGALRSANPASAEHNARASKTLPLGVTSSFQHWDPHPISIVSARGAHVTDVDGRRLLDMSMGFGAMMVGHLHPVVVDHVRHALDSVGTLFVTPSPTATEVAELFQDRFQLDMLRFTQSGTGRSCTPSGRPGVHRPQGRHQVEGGYHGGYDAMQVSVKPALADIGPADAPIPHIPRTPNPAPSMSSRTTTSTSSVRFLRRTVGSRRARPRAGHREPRHRRPGRGYLAGVRAACDEYGVILIFDEVKTGLTAGYAGALPAPRRPA